MCYEITLLKKGKRYHSVSVSLQVVYVWTAYCIEQKEKDVVDFCKPKAN